MDIINDCDSNLIDKKYKSKFFENIIVIFIDIVDYSITVKNSNNLLSIKNMLNNIFNIIDNLVIKYNIYKVETIGDAYFCIGGIYNFNLNNIYMNCLYFCYELVHNIKNIKNPNNNSNIQVRIGIDIGNIIGSINNLLRNRIMFIGNCINLSSRIQNYCIPNNIISTKNFYDKINIYLKKKILPITYDIKSFDNVDTYNIVMSNINIVNVEDNEIKKNYNLQRIEYNNLILKKSILIIDDSKLTLKILSHLFRKFNISTILCNCPMSAIEYFNEYIFDGILIDISMPKINGFELGNIIKKLDNNIIIIYMSSYDYKNVIHKPIDLFKIKKILIQIENNL